MAGGRQRRGDRGAGHGTGGHGGTGPADGAAPGAPAPRTQLIGTPTRTPGHTTGMDILMATPTVTKTGARPDSSTRTPRTRRDSPEAGTPRRTGLLALLGVGLAAGLVPSPSALDRPAGRHRAEPYILRRPARPRLRRRHGPHPDLRRPAALRRRKPTRRLGRTAPPGSASVHPLRDGPDRVGRPHRGIGLTLRSLLTL